MLTVIMGGICKLHNIDVDVKASYEIDVQIKESFPIGLDVNYEKFQEWALTSELNFGAWEIENF